MHRRDFTRLAIASGAVTVAGCPALEGEPDPAVVETEAEAGFLDTLFSDADIHVTVVNEGDEGEVLVSVEIYDAQETVLDRYSEEIFMREGEEREVTFEVSVDEEAESYDAFAEPAE